MSDTIGFIGLLFNLYSMYSRGEYRMRFFSLIANVIYIGYGFLMAAAPIIIGSSIAVLFHLFRLHTLQKPKDEATKN